MSAGIFYRVNIKPENRLAKELRGFGASGLFALFTILLTGTLRIHQIAVPVGALLVLLWVKLSRTPWQQIGYCRPAHWFTTIFTGIVFGCAFKLFTKAVAMPLLGAGPVNLAYQHLAGNAALLPYALWAMLVAGFAEETVYRGFLFERLQKLFGTQGRAAILIILLTSCWFALGHAAVQGGAGSLNALIVGLVFGTVYHFTRNLPLLMIAHAAYDLTALVLIYFGSEKAVAGFFFR